jgi:prepilin-type N-terminal cleavage/methylation domain-containing protein
MKINRRTKPNHAFTLIEMIGVLAVIAILAALLIPKVFQSITEAKINTVPVGCSTIKTGVIDHYAKYGALNTLWGTNSFATTNNYDTSVLLTEGFIDKPFAPRVGTSSRIQLVPCGGSGDAVVGTGISYDLDASGAAANDAVGSHLVEAVILGVPVADAQAISARIDGLTMSQGENTTTADLQGRVTYAASVSSAPVDVYIYLTHR